MKDSLESVDPWLANKLQQNRMLLLLKNLLKNLPTGPAEEPATGPAEEPAEDC